MRHLLPPTSAVKLLNMKRQLVALIVMLAIALQGAAVAFAGVSPSISSDCQTAVVSHSATPQDSCCSKGQRTMSCCLETCMSTVAAAVATTPQMLDWVGFRTLVPQFLSTHFSSRGDSPLIRPPIL